MTFEVGQQVVFKENGDWPAVLGVLGVVARVWNNKAQYLTIVTDDGRTFVRCASDVMPAPECGEHCSCDDCVPY